MVCFWFQVLICTHADSGGTPACVFGGRAGCQLAKRDVPPFLHGRAVNPMPSAGMRTLASLCPSAARDALPRAMTSFTFWRLGAGLHSVLGSFPVPTLMPEAHLINSHSLVFLRQSAQVMSLLPGPVAEQVPSLSPGPSPTALL